MILDLDDNPICSAGDKGYTFRFIQKKDTELTLPLKVDCKTGYKFHSQPTANLALEAQFVGDVSWTNIETSYLDLSPYNGTRKRIDVRTTTPDIDPIEVHAPLRVAKI